MFDFIDKANQMIRKNKRNMVTYLFFGLYNKSVHICFGLMILGMMSSIFDSSLWN